ncbi:heat shock cognate 70 kDa protein-like [Silene latifolia]|uniref:heat shock cognate 70 kDa protein-like n=1 Tax=Silene latifolia TaxID=37657 RepID=UPI003D788D7F
MGQNNEEWPAIGIDLGTSYSCVGVLEHGSIEIIANDQGNRTMPSWVAFTDSARFIGEAAQNQGCTNPANTIFDAKRLIGRTFYDDSVQEYIKSWPFKVIPGPDFGEDKRPLVVVAYRGEEKQFSAEEISAMILVRMKQTAEAYLGKLVNNAVITVPAYFNDCQRQATKVAGAITGLNVLRIINEPTAAAIAYGFNKMTSDRVVSKKNALVFDLGGGTFDVSLVTIEHNKFEVKAVAGDGHLGGSDFDNRLVSHFVKEFKKKHNKDINQSPRALGRLRVACERVKRALSMTTQTTIEINCLLDDIDFSSTITRARFDYLNVDLYKRCTDVVKRCLNDANISTSDVDDIFLIGGSTRIPKIQELLKELFEGKELSRNINPDEAVAYGAAVHAGILCGRAKEKEVFLADVTSLSLGVEVGPGNMSVVIPRNTTIPTRQERTYGVGHVKKPKYGDIDDLPEIVLEIPVYEGERSKTEDNNFLGVFELSGIFPPNGSSSLINVCFDIDINGILNVSAQDMSSGNKSDIKTINRSRLASKEVERLKNEAVEYKAQDNKYEQMVMAKNTLENYAHEMSQRFTNCSNSSQRVEPNELMAIMGAIQRIRKWLDQNSNQVLHEAMYEEKLNELTLICTPRISTMH